MDHVFIPYTVQAWKDGVCLFETDCELRVDYCLPDGRRGAVDWDVVEFHFDGPGKEKGKRIYTKVTRVEPLFHVMYNDLNRDWINERLCDMLADDGIIERYVTADETL